MFIPVGTDRGLKRPTIVNHVLIAVCVGVFIVQMATLTGGSDPLPGWQKEWMLKPRDFAWWNLLTYQFLHGGVAHLLGNMLFLWVFGPNIEDRIGRIGHLLLFLVGGVAAGAAHTAFSSSDVIGASGSISAITGAYLVFFPRTRVRILLFFFIIGIYQIPALWFIGFAIARDLFYTGFADTNIATLAHLGGYAFGIGVSLTLLATGLVSREPYDLFSLGRQAKRRRDFRSASRAGNSPWMHEAPRKKNPTSSDPAKPVSEAAMRKRSQISAAIRAGDRKEALRLYTGLASESEDAVLGRSNQLDVAAWLFEDGQHEQADDAYDRFLRRYPRDGEAPKVRLMSALIRVRYLGDEAGAEKRLEHVDPDRLSEQERSLYESLREETTG